MIWIAVLLIGVAVGWGLELLFDFWYWGRRMRRLDAKISVCRSELHLSEKKLDDAQAMVSQYQAKEMAYQKCQFDLEDRVVKYEKLETVAEEMTTKLQASQTHFDYLNTQVKEQQLKSEHLHDTLEQVDQWVESSMRQRVWESNTNPWKSGFDQAKERSKVFTRSMAATAHAQADRVTEQIAQRVGTTKAHIGRAIHQYQPKRIVNRIYCSVWTLIGRLNKKVSTPPSCSLKS